jgi:hypothetical protein
MVHHKTVTLIIIVLVLLSTMACIGADLSDAAFLAANCDEIAAGCPNAPTLCHPTNALNQRCRAAGLLPVNPYLEQ